MPRNIKSIYTSFPKLPANSTFVINLNWCPTVAVVIPEHKISIQIEMSNSDFLKETCQKCPHFIKPNNREEVNKELTILNDGVKPHSPTSLVRTFRASNKCYGINYYQDDEKCLADFAKNEKNMYEVTIPQTMLMYNSIRKVFSYHYCKIEDNEVKLAPFDFANIYNDGRVCWGTGNKIPADLAAAYALYWQAPFNSDLVIDMRQNLVQTLTDKHKMYDLASYTTWTNLNSSKLYTRTYELNYLSLSSSSLTKIGSPDAAMVTTDSKIVELLPREYLHDVMLNESDRGIQGAVCWVKKVNKDWFYQFERSIKKRDGTTPPLIGKRTSTKLASAGKIHLLGELDSLI